MRLVTPGVGPITLDSNTEPELFSMAKAGLGALGVVTQVREWLMVRVAFLQHCLPVAFVHHDIHQL
jgi:hypothetical protein